MHLTLHAIFALSTFSIFTNCAPAPQDPANDYLWTNADIPPGNPPSCSADTSTAPPADFASNPSWSSSMKTCLKALYSMNWDGTECNPPVGPAFGFYKGNDNFVKYNLDGADCYRACEPCLLKSIGNGKGVTTRCDWSPPNDGAKCWMGFNYGG